MSTYLYISVRIAIGMVIMRRVEDIKTHLFPMNKLKSPLSKQAEDLLKNIYIFI